MRFTGESRSYKTAVGEGCPIQRELSVCLWLFVAGCACGLFPGLEPLGLL